MANREPSLAEGFVRALEDLKRCMDAFGVSYAIIGGVAVVLHGYLRSTVDVDAIAEIDFPHIDEFIQIANQYGFETRIQDAQKFAQQNYILLLRHRNTGLPLDISFAFTPYEQEAIGKALSIRLGEVQVSVVNPEDLLIMKSVAQRPTDLLDILEIYRRYVNDIDLNRVRYWVEQFGEALDDPELWLRVEPYFRKD